MPDAKIVKPKVLQIPPRSLSGKLRVYFAMRRLKDKGKRQDGKCKVVQGVLNFDRVPNP